MTEITPQVVPDVWLITPKRFGDDRGFFYESYNRDTLAEAGFVRPFLQDNHSMSARRGTVRGLHFQAPPMAQDKLLRVVRGAILDVAIDIRRGSPTFGRSVSVELSDENGHQLLVPRGFAHGFMTLTDRAEVLYKVTAFYAPESEGGLLWNDPELNLDWPLAAAKTTVNARDAGWPCLADLQSPFSVGGDDGG